MSLTGKSLTGKGGTSDSWNQKHWFIDGMVRHDRKTPKPYRFDFKLFWLGLNIERLNQVRTPLFSRNRFNLFSFYDRDHSYDRKYNDSVSDNIHAFISKHVSSDNSEKLEIKNLFLMSFPRILGYVFNPVSFYIVEMSGHQTDQSRFCGVIQINNTFGEIKPYFVSPKHFHIERDIGQESHDGLSLKFNVDVEKLYYISPFIAHNNRMEFQFSLKDTPKSKKLSILILDRDAKTNELVMTANFQGEMKPFSGTGLLKRFFLYPLLTLRAILMIHWHAMKLWLKGIRFYRKHEYQEYQKGALPWRP